MKLLKILFTIALLAAMGTPVFASDLWIVTNPDPGATSCNWTGLPASIPATGLPVDSTGKYGCQVDIQSLVGVSGSYTVTAIACAAGPAGVQVCSAASTPLSFTLPAAPSVPAGVGLAAK